MTTQQAWQFALRESNNGVSFKQIAADLARQGYVSAKTGRPMTYGGISQMVSRARRGIIPRQRNIVKYAKSAGRYAPRGPRPQSENTQLTAKLSDFRSTDTVKPRLGRPAGSKNKAPAFVAPSATIDTLHAETMRGAREHLTKLFEHYHSVAMNLQILLDAVK